MCVSMRRNVSSRFGERWLLWRTVCFLCHLRRLVGETQAHTHTVHPRPSPPSIEAGISGDSIKRTVAPAFPLWTKFSLPSHPLADPYIWDYTGGLSPVAHRLQARSITGLSSSASSAEACGSYHRETSPARLKKKRGETLLLWRLGTRIEAEAETFRLCAPVFSVAFYCM